MSQTTTTEILDAAVRLLGEGSGALDMGGLARAAGISRAALYRCVPGKQALLRELRRAGLADPASLDRAGAPRQRVLEGARRAIEEHGLLTATTEQMAEAAGVSTATLYRCFSDRDELVRAAFDELPARSAIAGLAARPGDPLRPALSRAVTAMLGLVQRQPEMLRLVAFARGAEGRYLRRLRPHRGAGLGQLVRWLSEQQRRGRLRGDVAPARLASILLGMILSSGLPRTPPPAPSAQERSLEEEAGELVSLFLDGAARGRTRLPEGRR
ncbi:MAG: TetR/AcrR family transcriptional regulator [Myxococcales bacterium]